MDVTQLSPVNCAECGGEFTDEIILAGGSQPFTIEVRSHSIPVPGLYRCTGCHEAVKAGMRATGVTWELAREYLDEVFGPEMAGAYLLYDSDIALRQTLDAGAVSILLEALITLRDAGDTFEFIPECDGKHDHPVHPATVAHLN
jgi:hypothetical protein